MPDDVRGNYSARLARVDLSTGEVRIEELDPATSRRWLGGCALGAKLLSEEVPAEVGWADPRNRLMLLGGPLSGTPIAGAGGFTVCAKGAMTGGAASTQAQGVFGAYLRLAGLVGLIVEGAAERWTYLLVDESGGLQLRDASHLVGKDTWETEDALLAELGRRPHTASVASIGPAGENLVRWAAVMSDKGHAAAHNGVGAVMGAKRLKAVVVLRGKSTVPLADRARVIAVGKQFVEGVAARPNSVHYYGTLNGVQNNYATGNLPVRNYSTSLWSIDEEKFAKFTGKYMHEHFDARRESPCWACPNKHCQTMTITEGPYAGTVVEEPEYEQLSAFSANLGIDDVASAMMLGNVVDRLGLDTNEAGWIVGCVMECFERGILTSEDTGGLEVVWGNAEAARELLYRVARREGLGDVLAEGVRLAVQKIGRGAEQVGVYTMKGATPRGHDHRARWTEMFDTCVSESGGLDNSPGAAADLTQYGLPAKLDPFSPEALAKAEAKMKGGMQFEDSLVTCRFNTRTDLKLLAEAVSAVTGWDFTPEEAMAVGRRAVNAMRVFNIRSGLTAEVDRPSPRYGSTPTDGPAAGKSIAPHFAGMLREYYSLMGWDERGRPLPATLRALGLDAAAAELWGDR